MEHARIAGSHAIRDAAAPARPDPPDRGEARALHRPREECHTQGPVVLHRDARPGLPRHLRDRDEPHGPEDPLRDRQPPSGLRLRAGLRTLDGPRGEDARGRDPALLDGDVRAGRGLRRARVLAAGGAELLEHPEHARARGPAGLAARAPRVGSDRARRRPVHGQPGADRRLLRRLPRGRRGRGASALPRRVPRGTRARPLAAGPARPPGRRGRDLRAVFLRRRLRRERAHHRDHAQRPARPRARTAHVGPRLEARLLPGKAHGAFRRDRAGPPRPRGHARLHAGVSLLPGGLLVPPGARARSGRRRGDDDEVHRRVGLERSGPAVAFDGRLLADRAAGEMSRAAAFRPPRVDLAAFPAGRGVLGRSRGRGLGSAQVRLHVRAGDGVRPAAARHQQDLHQCRHDCGGRRGVCARLGPDQGLHDDRPADRDGRGLGRARRARRGHPRAGAQARAQGGQRRRRLLRAEVLDALPVGALRRRRDARTQAAVPEGEVSQRARREDEVARAPRGRDRVRAFPRRPADGARAPHGLEVGRAVRRLDGALSLRPVGEGLRSGGHPEGRVPAGLRPRRDPAVGRPRRLDQEALAPDRAHQGEEGDAHGGLQVGALLRLRRAGQRRGHDARAADGRRAPDLRRRDGPVHGSRRLPRRRQGRRLPAEGDAGPAVRRAPGDTGRSRLPPPHHVLEDRRRALPVAPQHDGRSRARHPRRRNARTLLGGVQPAHEALDGPGARARPRKPARGLRRRGNRSVRRRRGAAHQRKTARRHHRARGPRARRGRVGAREGASRARATPCGSTPPRTSASRRRR